jgi:hypothetical protein
MCPWIEKAVGFTKQSQNFFIFIYNSNSKRCQLSQCDGRRRSSKFEIFEDELTETSEVLDTADTALSPMLCREDPGDPLRSFSKLEESAGPISNSNAIRRRRFAGITIGGDVVLCEGRSRVDRFKLSKTIHDSNSVRYP